MVMRKFFVVLVGIFTFCSVFAAKTWTATGSLNVDSYGHTATLLSNSNDVLVTGGYSTSIANYLQRAEKYNPSGNFTLVKPMNVKRSYHAAVALKDGTVLVMGGMNGSGVLNSVERYNPTTDTWTIVKPMNKGRVFFDATSLNGKVIVTGGRNASNASTNNVEIYDPDTDTWTDVAPMNSVRNGHKNILIDSNHLLVMGGNTSLTTVTNTVEIYDIAANKWTLVDSMSTERTSYIAEVVSADTVFVAGGSTGAGAMLASAELFNITSKSWTNTTSMNIGRYSAASTKSLSNKVIITGGMYSYPAGLVTNTTSAYDYSSRLYEEDFGPMGDVRFWHTSTLLRDGRILVIGGSRNFAGDSSIFSADLYYSASSLQTIVLSGGSANVTSGGNTQPYVATGFDISGNVLMPFSSPGNFTWSIGAPGDNGTAVIYNNGTVTGGKNGIVTIQALSGGINGTTTLNVIGGIGPISTLQVSGNSTVPSGEQVTFIAIGKDVYGNPIDGLTFVWSAISGTGSATVKSNGVVTGSSIGTVTIQAVSGGVTGTAPLNVTVGALASINITGATSIASGVPTTTLSITGRDAGGNLITPTPTVTWSTGAAGDTGTATIDSSGVVTGQKDGTVTVKATSGGITGTTTLTVTGSYGSVTSITLSGGATSIPVGAKTPAFIASGLDIFNNTIAGLNFTWSIGGGLKDTGTATVDDSGVVTGGNVGLVTVKATSGGVTGTEELDVTTAPVNNINQSSSTGWIIPTAVVPAVAAVTVAAIVYFYKKAKNTQNSKMSLPVPEGAIVESTPFTDSNGDAGFMTVIVQKAAK